MYIKLGIAVVLVALAGAGYYLVYPYFNVVEVEEDAPDIVTQTNEDQADTTEEELVAGPVAHAIVDTPQHPASGVVRVLETEDGTVIRYEDFETINGPSLHVYLANDLEGTDYVDLGPAKGTKGNINYTVPEGIDIADYKYVMYWCVPFGVLFNYAEI